MTALIQLVKRETRANPLGSPAPQPRLEMNETTPMRVGTLFSWMTIGPPESPRQVPKATLEVPCAHSTLAVTTAFPYTLAQAVLAITFMFTTCRVGERTVVAAIKRIEILESRATGKVSHGHSTLTIVQTSESGDGGQEVEEGGARLGHGGQTDGRDGGGVAQAGGQLQQSHIVIVVGGIESGIDDGIEGGQLDLRGGQAVGADADGKVVVSLDAVGGSQDPIGGNQGTTASDGGSADRTTHPHMPRPLTSGGSRTSQDASIHGSNSIFRGNRSLKDVWGDRH